MQHNTVFNDITSNMLGPLVGLIFVSKSDDAVLTTQLPECHGTMG